MATREEELKPPPSAGQPTVLVVDTNPQVRKLMRYFLEQAGYEVDFLEDGYPALDRIRLRQPTLLITDVLLPHLDGLTLCRLLKSDPVTRHVPVLIYSVLDIEEKAREAGADSFLSKPIEKQRLLALVRTLSTLEEGA